MDNYSRNTFIYLIRLKALTKVNAFPCLQATQFLAYKHWNRASVYCSFVLQNNLTKSKSLKHIFMKQQPQRSKALHITLWIAQVLLAAMFLMSGFMKLSQPIDELSKMLPWASQVSESLVRFIGAAEVLGALGLILPSLLRIQPKLTPIAAVALAVVMLLAAIFHISRGETPAIGMNFVLIAIAAFIAWGRFKKAPIAPKSNRKEFLA